MSQRSKITFYISATGPGLTISVRLDQKEFWRGVATESPQEIMVDFDDDQDQDHVLEIELQGKLSEHTVIAKDGTILQDRIVQISDMTIDDIELGYLVTQVAEYRHDYNGTSDPILDEFYGEMGCNGTISLKFSTPVYLWLLEHM